MTKNIIWCWIIILFVCCTVSCNKSPDYSGVFIIGNSENVIETNVNNGVFDYYEYNNDNCPKEISYTFLGKEYNLKYDTSYKMEASNQKCNVYLSENSNSTGFAFDSDNMQLIRAFGISAKADVIDDKYCEEIITESKPKSFDLSEFEKRVTTTYSDVSDDESHKGMTRKTVSGFYSVGNQYEKYSTYDVEYYKEYEGIEYGDSIYAIFTHDSFSIEFVTDSAQPNKISNELCENLDERVFAFFKNESKSIGNKILTDVTIGRKKLRMIDDKAYIIASATCKWQDNDNNDFETVYKIGIEV